MSVCLLCTFESSFNANIDFFVNYYKKLNIKVVYVTEPRNKNKQKKFRMFIKKYKFKKMQSQFMSKPSLICQKYILNCNFNQYVSIKDYTSIKHRLNNNGDTYYKFTLKNHHVLLCPIKCIKMIRKNIIIPNNKSVLCSDRFSFRYDWDTMINKYINKNKSVIEKLLQNNDIPPLFKSHAFFSIDANSKDITNIINKYSNEFDNVRLIELYELFKNHAKQLPLHDVSVDFKKLNRYFWKYKLSELNNETINDPPNILFCVISCKKYEYRWNKYTNSNLDNILIICGDESLDKNYELIDNILYLNCRDGYEYLPEKIIYMIKSILKIDKFKNIDYLMKIDDDNIIVDINYNAFINDVIISMNNNDYDYVGNWITKTDEISGEYHFNNTIPGSHWHNKEFKSIYLDKNKITYCNGGHGYILSKKALDIIDRYYNFGDQIIINEEHIYEDIMMAIILHKSKIEAQHIDYSFFIIGDGTLNIRNLR